MRDSISIKKSSKILLIAALAANAVYLCYVLGETSFGDSFLVWWVLTFGSFYQVVFPNWFAMGPPEHLILLIRLSLEISILIVSIALGIYAWNWKRH
jgi:hypothetical protein